MNGTLTFSSAVNESCFDITIIDDDTREADLECFSVVIESETGVIGSPSVSTICISDNDGNPMHSLHKSL